MASAVARPRQPSKRRGGGGGNAASASSPSAFLSEVRFDALDAHPATLRAVREDLKYERLSAPQALFLPHLLAHRASDAFVRAGTGSGKTLGFLIPVLDAVFGHGGARSATARRSAIAASGGGAVSALVLSPARELALQIQAEARRLLAFHAGGCGAVAVIGGTDVGRDRRALAPAAQPAPCVLVATPGRLQDLLEDAATRARVLGALRVVVLDEADRLLDQGFVPAIQRIMDARPPAVARACRVLMFTATADAAVLKVAARFLRPGHATLDTTAQIQAALTPSARARKADQAHIAQRAVLAPPDAVHLALRDVLAARRAADPAAHKIMVFFPSNALVAFFAEYFKQRYGAPVLHLTGDLPQRQRQAATERFATGAGVTLFASDVAGRGMDFPDVTCVVQVGAVAPDTYKQRVGRTGRGGKAGEAVLVLGADERRAFDALRAVTPSLQLLDDAAAASTGSRRGDAPLAGPLAKLGAVAYRGTLGAYKAEARRLGWAPQQLVDAVAARFRGMGLRPLPDVKADTLRKMGLAGVALPAAGGGAGHR